MPIGYYSLGEAFMTVVMYPLKQQGQLGQRIDTRGPGRQSSYKQM